MKPIENSEEELQLLVEQELEKGLAPEGCTACEDAELYRILFRELRSISAGPVVTVEDEVIDRLSQQKNRREEILLVLFGGALAAVVLLMTFGAVKAVNPPLVNQIFHAIIAHINMVLFILIVAAVFQLLDRKAKQKIN